MMRYILLLVALMSVSAAAFAQPAAPAGPRLYVLDCGTITNYRPEEFGLTREEVETPHFANMCYLIVHPRGTLLWDTGLSDTLVGKPFHENMMPPYGLVMAKTLRGQLQQIGYPPDRIDFLALSHSHFDHIGNANLFAGSTWLVAKEERAAMFPPPPTEPPLMAEKFSELRKAKTILIGQDHDVFGDGSVIIKQAFGHSPGHSILLVKLGNEGNILLVGDLYHYPEELKLNRIGQYDKSVGVDRTREAVAKLAKAVNAKIWIAHDLPLFGKLRHAPAYYD